MTDVRKIDDSDYIEEEGENTLPAKKLQQIVNALSGEVVQLDTDENLTTRILSGSAKFRLMGMSAESFPIDADFQIDRELVFPYNEFDKVLSKISYAVSDDETRYVLNGILLSIREGNIISVATDGRRLALVEKVYSDEDLIDGDVILPIKVVNELGRLNGGDNPLNIKMSDSRISFALGETIITSKLIEGTYPNYRQVIPSDYENAVVFNRDLFLQVLNRVSVVIVDRDDSMLFELSENLMTMSASSTDFGDASEPIDVQYDGPELKIRFNPYYLHETLRNQESDDITIRLNNSMKPVVIYGDEGFLSVLMPMRN